MFHRLFKIGACRGRNMTGSEVDLAVAQFADLERSFGLGNKVALYDAISRSTSLGVALPEWAVTALQDLVIERWRGNLNRWSGYKALLNNYLRSEVYRACMLWVENKHHYKRLPTRCVQAWYEGELDDLPEGKAEAALELALRGLKGTPAESTSSSLMEKQRYFEANADAERLVDEDPQSAEFFEMSPEDYRAFIAASYRESRKTQISFGYNDCEVLFGLRPEGQFWGPPPGDPPKHIQAILEKEPIPWSEPPSMDHF